MDWKAKYIKYKTKYLILKQTTRQNDIQTAGQEPMILNYFDTLKKKLYPKCVKNPNESNDKTHVYGEMEYEGIEVLWCHVLQINPSIKYFLDIGSGRGKIPCWFAGLEQIVKSIGIEIVEPRFMDGKKLKSQLEENFPDQTKKIDLLLGDVGTYNLGLLTSNSPDTLVWISNLCFGEELANRVFSQVANQLAPGTIVTCSTKPFRHKNKILDKDNSSLTNTLSKKLKFIKTIKIQMSWWNNLSDVHVYQIIK